MLSWFENKTPEHRTQLIKKHDTLLYRVLLVFGEVCRNSKTSTPFTVYRFFGNESFFQYTLTHLEFINMFQHHEGFYPACRREILESLSFLLQHNIEDILLKYPLECFPLLFTQMAKKAVEEYESYSTA